MHVRGVALDPNVDLRILASRTPGFTGADLANVVNEAALLAARKEKDAVTMAELEEAIDRTVAGLERKSRVMSEKDKERVAIHEMGHALVALTAPTADPVHRVSIIPRGAAALGMTMQRPLEDRYLLTEPELKDRLAVLLGGRTAEEILFDKVVSTGRAERPRARHRDRARDGHRVRHEPEDRSPVVRPGRVPRRRGHCCSPARRRSSRTTSPRSSTRRSRAW